MTQRGLIQPEMALNCSWQDQICFCSISMDIDFRAILVEFLINQNFSSKFQLFMKTRNLGPNFVLAVSHWKLTLGQFWEKFFGQEKIFRLNPTFPSRIDLYEKNMCLTQSIRLKTLQMTQHGFKRLKNSSKWL